MGIPVISLQSRPVLGYIGKTLLHAIDALDWLAENEDEYIQKVLNLAGDYGKLELYRQTLRERVKNSPLLNEAQFTTDLEDAFKVMYRDLINKKI
jgi:predicted O-linked N-acetylglucosamine transferase (SPINDLY family)